MSGAIRALSRRRFPYARRGWGRHAGCWRRCRMEALMKARFGLWTKLAVVGASVLTMFACSSSEEDAPGGSSDTSFCGALAAAYTKCGGAATSCGTTMAEQCTKVAGLLSPSVLTAATTCLQA